jgi:hypothetical protein
MNKFPDITKLDWEILNALADDYESIEQIESLINDLSGISTNKEQILDRLEYLHWNCYVFLIMNKTFERAKLEDEIRERTQARYYWFGRTEKGYLAWQELTEGYLHGTEPAETPDRS